MEGARIASVENESTNTSVNLKAIQDMEMEINKE